MIFIDVKKGYLPKISGAPSKILHVLEKPSQVALLPEKIPFDHRKILEDYKLRSKELINL